MKRFNLNQGGRVGYQDGTKLDEILKEDESIEGFNILINNGAIAGQTVFHLHFHLIPRRKNDTEKKRFN